MVNLAKEELYKIAQLSALKLEAKELELFRQHISDILNYVDQLQEVQLIKESNATHNINIFRDDEIKACAANNILEQAPQEENRYFVVPKILE